MNGTRVVEKIDELRRVCLPIHGCQYLNLAKNKDIQIYLRTDNYMVIQGIDMFYDYDLTIPIPEKCVTIEELSTIIDEFNHLILTTEMCESLNLKENDSVQIEVEDNQMTICKYKGEPVVAMFF